MLNLKPKVVAALKASTTLVTLLGTADKILFNYPDNFNNLPVVTYRELDNRGDLYADNAEYGSEVIFVVDVWSKSSTTAISQAVDDVMQSIGFTRQNAVDLYESDTKIFHKALTYRGDFTEDDI